VEMSPEDKPAIGFEDGSGSKRPLSHAQPIR
jgi:hypothetical protein